MINIKNIGVQESVLLLAFSFCVGFVGRAEAIELALPVSIHEILPPEQIEKVKNGNALKVVQQGGARKAMKGQAGANAAVMQRMMGMRLGGIMNSKRSTQVEKKAAPKLETLDAEATIQAASASDATTKK